MWDNLRLNFRRVTLPRHPLRSMLVPGCIWCKLSVSCTIAFFRCETTPMLRAGGAGGSEILRHESMEHVKVVQDFLHQQ